MAAPKLERAEYTELEFRPALTLVVDGEQGVFISEEFKPAILQEGYVSLRDMKVDLPDGDILVGGTSVFLSKVTTDPTILNVVRRFSRAVFDGTFRLGPVYP